jgi:hypothetical protein
LECESRKIFGNVRGEGKMELLGGSGGEIGRRPTGTKDAALAPPPPQIWRETLSYRFVTRTGTIDA